MATDRGRWFLSEYARRNRQTDTVAVLAAIDRMMAAARADTEARLAALRSSPDPERLRDGLADLSDVIARTRAEIAASNGSDAKPDQSDSRGAAGEAAEPFDCLVRNSERTTFDIFTAASQIQEMAWAMRERGIDAQVCDRLDGYATAIYAACSLDALNRQRTRRVIHVHRYLEARVQAMAALWDVLPQQPKQSQQEQTLEGAHETAVPVSEAPAQTDSGGPSVESRSSDALDVVEPVHGDKAVPQHTASNMDVVEPVLDDKAVPQHTPSVIESSFTDNATAIEMPSEDRAAELLSEAPSSSLSATEAPVADASAFTCAAADQEEPVVPAFERPIFETVAVEAAPVDPVPTAPNQRASDTDWVVADLRVFAADVALAGPREAPANQEPPVRAAVPDGPVFETGAGEMPTLPLVAEQADAIAAMTASAPAHALPAADIVSDPQPPIEAPVQPPQPAAGPVALLPGKALIAKTDIAEELFADVMALSEAERIALFT